MVSSLLFVIISYVVLFIQFKRTNCLRLVRLNFKCGYRAWKAAPDCRRSDHQLVFIKGTKRYFRCRNCAQRTITFERYPNHCCKCVVKPVVSSISVVLSLVGDCNCSQISAPTVLLFGLNLLPVWLCFVCNNLIILSVFLPCTFRHCASHVNEL